MSDNPDPTKRKSWYPPGEPSPTIYPEGGGDPSARRPFDFPLIKTRGKSAAQTVIEDRGPEMPGARDSEGESEHADITRPPRKKGSRVFNPLKIRGKPLSETVIEERREARY